MDGIPRRNDKEGADYGCRRQQIEGQALQEHRAIGSSRIAGERRGGQRIVQTKTRNAARIPPVALRKARDF
ncbi:hypothetical protein GCM10009101_05790 [Brevundimonas lenta]